MSSGDTEELQNYPAVVYFIGFVSWKEIKKFYFNFFSCLWVDWPASSVFELLSETAA